MLCVNYPHRPLNRPCFIATTVVAATVTAASVAGFVVTKLYFFDYFNGKSENCGCSVLKNETLLTGPCAKMPFAAREIKCLELHESANSAIAFMFLSMLIVLQSVCFICVNCQNQNLKICSDANICSDESLLGGQSQRSSYSWASD